MLHALLVPPPSVAPRQSPSTPAASRLRMQVLGRPRMLRLRLHSACSLPNASLAVLFTALLLTTAPDTVHAQNIYRSVDANGRITFSDRLHPGQADIARADAATQRTNSSAQPTANRHPSSSDTSLLPYSLRQSRDKYPVTFYSTGDCNPCDDARRMLVQRGIPYTERSVISAADLQALQSLSGQDRLPFATIGKQQLVGWDAEQWQRYLDLAGYPTQSELPATWKPAAATALAPVTQAAPSAPATATRATASETTTAPEPTRPPTNPANPSGITF